MKLRKAIIGLILGILLGAVSHPFGVTFLSSTGLKIHSFLAVTGFAIGFLIDNRKR